MFVNSFYLIIDTNFDEFMLFFECKDFLKNEKRKEKKRKK